jgi:predicted acyl esterase
VLHLHVASTAADTDWIVKLSDVGPDGRVLDLTQGWLRASHRALDTDRSTPWRPYHPHDRPVALSPGEPTAFAIEVLSTAHVLRPGHRLRLAITSSDGSGFAMQGLSHYTVGFAGPQHRAEHLPAGTPAHHQRVAQRVVRHGVAGGLLEDHARRHRRHALTAAWVRRWVVAGRSKRGHRQ